jgi:hypothetical protein
MISRRSENHAQLTGQQRGCNKRLPKPLGGPGCFRIGFAPSIVNPNITRLWAFRSDWRDRAPLNNFDFEYLARLFREEQIDLGRERVAVSATILSAAPRVKHEELLGWAKFEVFGVEQTVYFSIAATESGSHHPEYIKKLIARAGAALPNRVRDAVAKYIPSSAVAWWMAVVWEFSTLRPSPYYGITISENQSDKELLGIQWPELMATSLSAMEAAGLIVPDPNVIIPAKGEWSLPMAKAEFARRMLPRKKGARARDVESIFKKMQKEQVADKKWIFRLDTLPDATRRKLED